MPTEEPKFRVVLLCGPGLSTRIMYHALASDFRIVAVIQEHKPSARGLLARRVKKLGLPTVLGQLAFMVFNKMRRGASEPRIHELISKYRLNDSDIPEDVLERVESVNDGSTLVRLAQIAPDAIVVNGTRIISNKILTGLSCPFVNTHMGITPKYRGVHGAYWALATDDAANCGVTVHLVDKGIDTGAVLYQDRIEVEPADDFNTYPLHQLHKAIPLMKAALTDIRLGRIAPVPGVGPSALWSHPTLLQYVRNRLRRGVK